MIRKTLICNLCEKPNIDEYITFTVKQTYFDWYEHGLSRKRIHICMDCIESLKSAAKQDRKLREKEDEDS